ncbi:NodT family efflux transporter outer membrane factor (OMF) lipoprotein [Duganella sp. 1224]|uniref:efflux transporter outer membrane subunit n=1 Tax=Duganella sp. 1224 TaxID=2587052 RepID=UPI0017DFF998|nr:efflux transporter outer membrane subunit [Duganella sp. 1224]NYE59921.1 NodT family efflux transporter outer membrane factor (OMF) lipoprotein [Duganella sp. 1224]
MRQRVVRHKQIQVETRRPGALAACLAGMLLAGCAHKIPVAEPPPAVELPAGWSQSGTPASHEWPDTNWWQRFGSDELSQLVREGQDSNLELAAALSRVRQAAAQARIAGVALLPSVDAYAGASRDLPITGNHNANVSSTGQLQVSYELDFWGKNAAGVAAADASLRANFYDRQTVALTVTSGIVSTYLQILSLHDRLIVARENARTAQHVLSLVEAQSSVGAATSVDLARQRSAVASQQAALPALQQQEREAQSALAILLGKSPQTFRISDSGLDTIRLPEVTAGMPSELLSRRPDIRRSEALLAAASANVDMARAALFPSIRLTGSTGTQSSALVSLLNAQNLFANVGASLVAPIFDGGRLRTERDLAIEQKQELVQNYRATVLSALAEVDTVLGQIHSLDEQRRLKEVELEQSRVAFNLSEIRYKAGAEDLMTVLDTQRSLADVQNELGILKLKRLQATVSLYKALGGGWQAG